MCVSGLMAEREVEPSGSDRGGTGSSLYGATDSAASSGRADDDSLTPAGGGDGSRGSVDGCRRDGDGSGGSATDLEAEGGDLEAGINGATAAAAAVAAAAGTQDEEAEGSGKKGKKGKKQKKAKKPQMKDDIKTSMASERTFFKVCLSCRQSPWGGGRGGDGGGRCKRGCVWGIACPRCRHGRARLPLRPCIAWLLGALQRVRLTLCGTC